MDQADAAHSCHCNCHRQCQCNCQSSTRPSPTYIHTTILLSRTDTNETADNLPGAGRALDKLYQNLGRKLERGLGVVADKAGFGPAAAGRRVEKSMEVIYPWGYPYRPPANGLLEKLRLEVAERNVREGCKALIKYSQSALPSTQLRALSTILEVRTEHYSHTNAHFTKVESTKKIFSTTYHQLHEIESSSDGFDLWSSFYEGDYDEDALSRLLRTSRTVSLSVENNHFNSLVQRMMRPTPSDIYVQSEYALLETEAEIKSCWMEFFNYMLHPELSSLAFLYFNQLWHMTSEVQECLEYSEDMVIELCLKLFLIFPNDYSDWGLGNLPHLSRFLPRDKRWIDKQLRLLDDPKKTANPVSIEPGVLGEAVLDAACFITFGLGVAYRKMSCPSSLLLERYEQVRREITPLSEENECQLQHTCGWIAETFEKEDKILLKIAIPDIYDQWWYPFSYT